MEQEKQDFRKDRVQGTLQTLVRLFESGQAPQALSFATLPSPHAPCDHWSFANNLILWMNNTGDARGYRQWQAVGRHVVKGARALYILAPLLRTPKRNQGQPRSRLDSTPASSDEGRPATNTAPHGDSSEPKRVLSGFLAVPVFRFEDTDGEPLQHDLEPPEAPPLAEVAKAWGLKVQYIGYAGPYLGLYRRPFHELPEEILLCTHEEQVFFHELAHAAQYRVWAGLKPEEKLRKEVAAELAACVLARLVGRKQPNEGSSYRYIKHWCEREGKDLGKTLWAHVADTEKILRAILDAQTTLAQGAS